MERIRPCTHVPGTDKVSESVQVTCGTTDRVLVTNCLYKFILLTYSLKLGLLHGHLDYPILNLLIPLPTFNFLLIYWLDTEDFLKMSLITI